MRVLLLTALSIDLLWSSFGIAEEIKSLQLSTPFQGSVLFIPNDHKAHPGIILLHGSEGGSLPYTNLEALFLSQHGYAVLAFCWYNCLRNPILSPIQPLENVELRKTIQALKWLKESSFVKGHEVAIAGWSRGGEQAVLLGSLPEITQIASAIAVHTPSDRIVSGFSWTAMDRRCWVCTTFDLACFQSSDDPNKWDWKNLRWNASCGSSPKLPENTQSWLLDGIPLKIGKKIEIENFKKPVFISVGDKDELWDYQQSIRIQERLRKFGQPVEIHVFTGEHHNFSNANENERHRLLIDFLKRSLN